MFDLGEADTAGILESWCCGPCGVSSVSLTPSTISTDMQRSAREDAYRFWVVGVLGTLVIVSLEADNDDGWGADLLSQCCSRRKDSLVILDELELSHPI